QQVEQIQVAAAGVIAVRSKRERGHSGLSAARGHRSAAALIQDITGSTKADANRKARVGEALLDDEPGPVEGAAPQPEDVGASDERPTHGPWFQPVRDALRDGRLTASQFDAIRRGLGELPEIDSDPLDADAIACAREEARAAWAQAAEQLVDEAAER